MGLIEEIPWRGIRDSTCKMRNSKMRIRKLFLSRNRNYFNSIAFDQLAQPPSTAQMLITQYQRAANIAPRETTIFDAVVLDSNILISWTKVATWPHSGMIYGRRVRRGGKINSSNNQKVQTGGICPHHRQCLRQHLQRGPRCLHRL